MFTLVIDKCQLIIDLLELVLIKKGVLWNEMASDGKILFSSFVVLIEIVPLMNALPILVPSPGHKLYAALCRMSCQHHIAEVSKNTVRPSALSCGAYSRIPMYSAVIFAISVTLLNALCIQIPLMSFSLYSTLPIPAITHRSSPFQYTGRQPSLICPTLRPSHCTLIAASSRYRSCAS